MTLETKNSLANLSGLLRTYEGGIDVIVKTEAEKSRAKEMVEFRTAARPNADVQVRVDPEAFDSHQSGDQVSGRTMLLYSFPNDYNPETNPGSLHVTTLVSSSFPTQWR